MGANVSTSIQRINSAITTDVSTNCQNQTGTEQTIRGLKIKVEGCGTGDINVRNEAVVNQVCDLDQISGTIAEATQAATSSQVAGLGLFPNVNTTIAERTQAIKTKLEQTCGNFADVKQTIENSEISLSPWCYPGKTLLEARQCYPCQAGDINVVNNMTSQQQCIAKVVNETRDKLIQRAENEQKNSIIPDLGSLLLFSLLPCIVIIVIIIIVNLAKKGKSSAGDTTGNAGLEAVAKAQAKAAPAAGDNAALGGVAAAAAGNAATGAAKGFVTRNFAKFIPQGKTKFTTQLGKYGGIFKGGARKNIATALEGLPIVVVIIIAVVWFAKSAELREQNEQ
jgi:hypothetical protein